MWQSIEDLHLTQQETIVGILWSMDAKGQLSYADTVLIKAKGHRGLGAGGGGGVH